ncbi:BlaI/MecI/CopY family transcriptional regulator [Niastella sp. MAH-29]|uniref:BlaI/MecI/CopY family transcriptional regulator n=2 Tax=Chitinophagaceae TaxID=563835 RepID=A0ABS3Z0F6_9BACT|nr:BlaI/MecI/CopY family transcriptional regulator [Niastella soli]MBO9203656.1 BlaI/MecI/CopY family transcriptional regulator [Niastella soli]
MKSLTKAEEQVMQILWELKHGFLKDIMDKMPEPKAHSNTVATILKILIEKGFVNYEVQGRNNLYKPAVSKSEYGKKSINQLVKGYFEGSPAKLLSHFVNENKLSQEELEALLEQIKNAKNHNQ